MTGEHSSIGAANTPAAGAVDLLVVGGGINGTGIARDAAGRGLSVVLCEQGDLAQATSSASTKLIHGGLRYLEHYEFRLVREALQEREVLLANAPHIIWPMRFVLPHAPGMRPAWMIRLGLFLYDHLGKRERLPGSRALDLGRDPAGAPLQAHWRKGFSYADCWVEDSRLVVLNAMDARERGTAIHTRTRCTGARREGGLWHASLRSMDSGTVTEVRARALVNAAGPWVGDVLRGGLGHNTTRSLRLVKGSHIVVPKLFEGEHAYIFQNDDRRIVFAIPYEGRFTLIGTTEVDHSGDPAAVRIGEAEVAYLCRVASTYFRTPVTPAQAVWSYSGVRPLLDDSSANASAVTRDYVLELDAPAGAAPLLSVFGGKITTYRRLAEAALAKLAPLLPGVGAPWTAAAPLPGGDLPGADFAAFLAGAGRRWPWLAPAQVRRLARAYGTRLERLIGGARSLDGLGRDFGGGVREAELAYAIDQELIREADDFLWRRSKLGLHLDADGQTAIANWIEAHAGGERAPPRTAVA